MSLTNAARWIVDLLLAGGLAGALLLVSRYESRHPAPFVAEEWSADGGDEAASDADGGTEATPARPGPRVRNAKVGPKVEVNTVQIPTITRRTLKIAVSPPQHDDMGKLLDRMGEGYSHYSKISLEDLANPRALVPYEVLFLTCRSNAKFPPGGIDVIRDFVRGGKTLYVSDLWYSSIAKAFPEAMAETIERGQSGAEQTVLAEVVDPSLRDSLGESIRLNFDKPGWSPPRFDGAMVTTLLRGQYRTSEGIEQMGQLLVKFPYGKGTVIFTSFHNALQNDESEMKLLRSLVVIVATARLVRELRETVLSGGLSERKGSLLTASRGGEPVVRTYDKQSPGPLKFFLGFREGEGAHLRLTVTGPDGRSFEKDGNSGLEIDVPNAAAGTWKTTITILNVPYDEFPYKLVIAD
jgi:hypothetical protein